MARRGHKLLKNKLSSMKLKKVGYMLTTVALLLAFTSCATLFTQGGANYRRGNRAYLSQDYVTAVKELLVALEKNPEFRQALDLLPKAFNEGTEYYLSQTLGNPGPTDTVPQPDGSDDRTRTHLGGGNGAAADKSVQLTIGNPVIAFGFHPSAQVYAQPEDKEHIYDKYGYIIAGNHLSPPLCLVSITRHQHSLRPGV